MQAVQTAKHLPWDRVNADDCRGTYWLSISVSVSFISLLQNIEGAKPG